MATLQKSQGFDRYALTAKDLGVCKQQFLNFVRGQAVLQAKQLLASAAARLCDLPGGPTEIGYGGARGGGKSHWIVVQVCLDDCQRVAGLKCLILRKIGKKGKESFEDLRARILIGKIAHHYVSHEGVLSFPNGSRIILGHYQNESDIDAYLGLEYDVIAIEEATTLSADKYKFIRTCCRTSKTDWRPRIYCTTNPGGIGHGWFKERFIAPFKMGCETSTRFIAATVYDNQWINPEYRAILEELTGWQRRAYLLGDWDIAAGQFFSNFREKLIVQKPFVIPANWQTWGSFDYGFAHYTSFHAFAKDSDGNRWVWAEYGKRKALPKVHAQGIKETVACKWGGGRTVASLRNIVAGHDVFSDTGRKNPDSDESRTIATDYAENGIRLTKANIDRINGAGEILSAFGDDELEIPIEPTVFIFETCVRLIECIPSLVHDPHRPEDVLKVDCNDDGKGGDDFYDDFRYGMMADAQKRVFDVSPDLLYSGSANQ